MRRSACAGALIAGLAFGAVGCGGGGGDSDNIKESIKAFFAGLGERDGKKVCSLLSNALVQAAQVSGSDCAKSLKVVAAQAVPENKRNEVRNVQVSDVKVTGTTATALVKGTRGSKKMSLVKENGKWKLGSITGVLPERQRVLV